MIQRCTEVKEGQISRSPKILTTVKDGQKYPSIGLILVLTGLKIISGQGNLNSTRGCFNKIFKSKLKNTLPTFPFYIEDTTKYEMGFHPFDPTLEYQ